MVFQKKLKIPCRQTGRVARLRGRILGSTTGRVAGALLVLGMSLFQVCVQSNHNLVLIVTLLVSLTCRLVVGVQVNHVGDEGTVAEKGVIIHPLIVLALDTCKEIPGCLA